MELNKLKTILHTHTHKCEFHMVVLNSKLVITQRDSRFYAISCAGQRTGGAQDAVPLQLA
jgi:hypothetical protein